jgi:hypothetical protein
MRTLRGLARFVFMFGAFSSLAVVAAPAHAQLWVAASPAEHAAVEHAELAYAIGEGATATWLALRVRRGSVAVVAALGEGARASVSPDAWFSALEASASPNVIPPPGSPDCGAVSRYVRVGWPRSRGAAAVQLRLESSDEVAATLEAEGLVPPRELPALANYAVWLWSETEGAFTTQTLRIEGVAAPLLPAPGATFPISVSALSNGPVWFENELDTATLPVTFVGGERPTTDYRERLGEFLDSSGSLLLEARARSLIFDWSIYGNVVSVAPLVRRYAEQAGDELSNVDVEACREQLARLSESGAPASSACGDAVDAERALSLLDPVRATLQRFQLSSLAGVEPGLLLPGGEPSPPLLRAQSFDGSACASEPPPPIVIDRNPPVGGGDPPVVETVVVDETVIVEREPVEIGCGGEPEPEPSDQSEYGYYGEDDEVDCSSDTSGSSDTSSDEDCSSDTSGSSDTSSDEDCSSDTSGSSDASSDEGDCSSDSTGSQNDSEDCSSDSSSSTSSSSDDGCSGDSSSGENGGYDGDTCTGQAAPPSGSKAQAGVTDSAQGRLKRRRPQRLKASAWTLGFLALVLPIRRRKRRASAGG